MDFNDTIGKLDYHTKIWASQLTSDDLAYILQSVYRIPGLIQSLKSGPLHESKSAADIGKKGEADFIRICKGLPSNYHITNTAKQGKQADFIITFVHKGQQKTCLVDIKKYTTSVPKKELDKFYEDLTFGSYDAGLIISYGSKFTGIADDITIEDRCMSYGTVPIMYLANTYDDLILQCIQLLMMKVTEIDRYSVNCSKIESGLSYINNAISQSTMTRRMLSELSVDLTKSLLKAQENLLAGEVQTKRAIKDLALCIHEIQSPPLVEKSVDEKFVVENPTAEKQVVDKSLAEKPTVEKSIEPRPDNVETSVVESGVVESKADAEFMQSIEKTIDAIEATEANETPLPNHPLIHSLHILNWDVKEYPRYEFRQVLLYVKLLRTKVNVTIRSADKLTPPGLIRKKAVVDAYEYTCTLNQELIDWMAKIIEKYEDTHKD